MHDAMHETKTLSKRYTAHAFILDFNFCDKYLAQCRCIHEALRHDHQAAGYRAAEEDELLSQLKLEVDWWREFKHSNQHGHNH